MGCNGGFFFFSNTYADGTCTAGFRKSADIDKHVFLPPAHCESVEHSLPREVGSKRSRVCLLEKAPPKRFRHYSSPAVGPFGVNVVKTTRSITLLQGHFPSFPWIDWQGTMFSELCQLTHFQVLCCLSTNSAVEFGLALRVGCPFGLTGDIAGDYTASMLHASDGSGGQLWR